MSHAHELEQGARFMPRFADQADRSQPPLITAIVVDASDNAVLMVAHMSRQALDLSVETGIAHFWSRSRRAIWRKGESSGNELRIEAMLTDCDQDAVVLRVGVQGDGVACHTGARSCFYRALKTGADGEVELVRLDTEGVVTGGG